MKTIFRNQKTLKSAHIIPFFLLQEFTPTKINSKWIMDLSVKQKKKSGVSLVAQWLRILLPMQGTRVRTLVRVREDPTCRGATKPVRHNY